MSKWLEYTLWAIGIIAVVVAGGKLIEYINYCTTKVYISADRDKKEFHLYENCSRMHGHDVFTVKLHEALDNHYQPCKECEKRWDIGKKASEPASTSNSYIR